MADRKYLETIEHLTGTGDVYEESRKVASVRYDIRVLQEKIESVTHSGTNIIDDLKRVSGTVDPVDVSMHELFGKVFTLVFEDGRRMNFFVTNTQTGSISASSGIS
jgi:hypothetical protein